MRFLDGRTIEIDKIVNELDKFVLRFVDILEKHTKYVIVSGYVAILFGRSRATEDIDIIVPPLSKDQFGKIFSELVESGYWFINSDDPAELFDMLKTSNSIRTSKAKAVAPNIELKFAKDDIDRDSLNNSVTVIIGENKLLVSPIESQIAYKLYILTSDKDIEDANHLLEVFKDHLNKDKLEKYSAAFKRRFK